MSKYTEVKNKVESLIKDYALTMPTSIFDFAKLLGIKIIQLVPEEIHKIVQSKDPLSIESNDPDDILGYFDKEENTFYINKDQHITRKRFTVAHEIGHHQLHSLEKGNHFRRVFLRTDLVNLDESKEAEANYFAGYLLIPDEQIIKKLPYTKLMMGGDYMVKELAKLFAVSPEAMRIRLKTFKQENPEMWEEYNLSQKLF